MLIVAIKYLLLDACIDIVSARIFDNFIVTNYMGTDQSLYDSYLSAPDRKEFILAMRDIVLIHCNDIDVIKKSDQYYDLENYELAAKTLCDALEMNLKEIQ